MGKQIVLHYKRVEHHYEGRFEYTNPQWREAVEPFSLEYREMLKRLCNILKEIEADASTKVTLQRIDCPGLLPVPLDEGTITLLRTDPVAGIAALTYEQPSTPLNAVAQKKAEGKAYIPAPLRAGVDTLAQAFGPLVYTRVREGKAECPCCGFWMRDVLQVPEGGVADITVVCTERCKTSFELRVYGKWAAVNVAYLLSIKSADRFYLPREWNHGKPWVSREDLQQKFDTFLKEKEQAHG